MLHATDSIGMAGAQPGKVFIPGQKYTPDQEEILNTQAAELEAERINEQAEANSIMSRIEAGNNPL